MNFFFFVVNCLLARLLLGLTPREGTRTPSQTQWKRALVVRLPPLLPRPVDRSDNMSIPLVDDEIDWGSDTEDGLSHAYPNTLLLSPPKCSTSDLPEDQQKPS